MNNPDNEAIKVTRTCLTCGTFTEHHCYTRHYIKGGPCRRTNASAFLKRLLEGRECACGLGNIEMVAETVML